MTDKNIVYDVQVANAYKSHGEKTVFNGLYMNVKSGSIYGLLGPSGCGKSTLLQCILGMMTLDSGTINLKVDYLKHVGYMPQDLCLEETLTIEETFEFYGSLFQMSKTQIKNRKHELLTFLQLPDMERLIQDLSGGQCRRVSLAIALLHNPEIIILDEPTVGIDSVLRQEIWSQFVIMAERDKKTIIVSTHYIEEANGADCIGLMRNGVIAEEGPPKDIIAKYDSDSLESAFLSVCFTQEKYKFASNNDIDKVMDDTIKPIIPQSKNLMKLEKKVKCHRINALIRKNIKVFSRNFWFVVFSFLLPILQAYFISVGIGNDIKGLKVAYTNDEINCQNYSSVNGCIYDTNNNQTMSCDIIKNLESHDFTLIHMKDHKAAEKLVHDQAVAAFIYFPKNYTKGLIQFIDDFNNYQMQAYVYFNNHNILEKGQIQIAIRDAMNDLKENILNGCSINPRAIGLPIKFSTLLGNDVKIGTHSMVGIYLIIGVFYYSSIFSVTMMLTEKMDGTLTRSMLAGVTVLEFLISLFCFANILILTQSIAPVVITYMIFSNPIQITSGLYMCAISMVIVGWLGFFFGLFSAGLTTSVSGGVYIMNGLAIIQVLLSGSVWPLEGQPPYLKAVTQFFPINLGGKTINSVTLRGWEWNHPLILTYVGTLSVLIVLMVLVLIVLGKCKKEVWVLNK